MDQDTIGRRIKSASTFLEQMQTERGALIRRINELEAQIGSLTHLASYPVAAINFAEPCKIVGLPIRHSINIKDNGYDYHIIAKVFKEREYEFSHHCTAIDSLYSDREMLRRLLDDALIEMERERDHEKTKEQP